ncbi:hypothetical protein QJS04_geneDACA023801 [Acorus gramineus]|uniref:Leucine-rich repeat-containing N-terminal plant-type domain-containing protein n=1 Tax=Acorus gramineus TaxID=55184 RepID=A0AAV8ZZK0_ACOGR|nr:hypothetical protein QJS04_geneDACA023801 [Acorus gramineus]
MLEDWVGGGDCCNWTGVECDALSYPYRAVSIIDLSGVRSGFSQKWYPNASLFGQFTELKELLLSVNGIAGWVNPQDIWHLQKVQQLDLSANHLNDESIARLIVPWIHNLTSLFELNLGWNNLKEIRWISNITSLSSLDLSNTQIKDFSDLCQLQDLQELDLSKNSMKGNIDTCLKRSIPISLFNSSNIMFLDIRKNFFSGPVPTQVCHMQNLHILDLSNNYLSGTIPNCLKNITSWIIDSPIYYPVFKVNPFTFFDISTTTVVSSLTTKGRFYSYMGTPLSLMTELDLSKNQFSGPLPFQMGYLSALHSLNLSNNHLTGPIPNSFQNLKNIESLDLSNNYLSGEISSQLVKLHSLSVFRVAYNNLSGIIPYKDQFCTFNKSSFEGNPGLSGVLIEKNCWSMHGTSQTYHDSNIGDHEETSKAIDNDVIFYSFIAASFAIGFWGVIAVVAFNKNGRIKFFMAADDFCYACMDVILGLIKRIEKYWEEKYASRKARLDMEVLKKKNPYIPGEEATKE